MSTVNIHEAKTHLSRLVEQAARGESFVIAKAGKPMVQVTALDAPAAPMRLGFLTGEILIPGISTAWATTPSKRCSVCPGNSVRQRRWNSL